LPGRCDHQLEFSRLEEWDGLPGRVTKEKTTGPGSYYQLGSSRLWTKLSSAR
jgi:hypothetical protein